MCHSIRWRVIICLVKKPLNLEHHDKDVVIKVKKQQHKFIHLVPLVWFLVFQELNSKIFFFANHYQILSDCSCNQLFSHQDIIWKIFWFFKDKATTLYHKILMLSFFLQFWVLFWQVLIFKSITELPIKIHIYIFIRVTYLKSCISYWWFTGTTVILTKVCAFDTCQGRLTKFLSVNASNCSWVADFVCLLLESAALLKQILQNGITPCRNRRWRDRLAS